MLHIVSHFLEILMPPFPRNINVTDLTLGSWETSE